jgi:hypothetical protein
MKSRDSPRRKPKSRKRAKAKPKPEPSSDRSDSDAPAEAASDEESGEDAEDLGVAGKRWAPEEDAVLKSLIKKHGNDMVAVHAALPENMLHRSIDSLGYRARVSSVAVDSLQLTDLCSRCCCRI